MSDPTLNLDLICQEALQAKLNMYQAKEHFEAILKIYNDRVDNLLTAIEIMKKRIQTLENTNKNKEEN